MCGWQNETKATDRVWSRLLAKRNQSLCPINAPSQPVVSLHNDPALDAGAQRANALDVGDHFAGDRRRVAVSERGRRVCKHYIAIAAAGEEVVGGDTIDALLVKRRITNLDRRDAAAGRPLEISIDHKTGDLREAAGRIGKLREPVLDRGLECAPADL